MARLRGVTLTHGLAYVPPPLYAPPAEVAMLPMRELRQLHRTWLTPHMLDRAQVRGAGPTRKLLTPLLQQNSRITTPPPHTQRDRAQVRGLFS